MIQDIAPLHLYNEWHNVQPEKDDWVICMQERKILVRGVQNAICFPRYAEIKSQVQNGDRFVYLFAVGEERFFLYQQHQYKEREELNLMHLCRSVENQRKNSVAEQTLLSEEEIVFHYETTRYLRGAAPQHMCYAGLVGAQLAGWYAVLWWLRNPDDSGWAGTDDALSGLWSDGISKDLPLCDRGCNA